MSFIMYPQSFTRLHLDRATNKASENDPRRNQRTKVTCGTDMLLLLTSSLLVVGLTPPPCWGDPEGVSPREDWIAA